MGSIAGCLALAEGMSPDAGWVDHAIRRIAYRETDAEWRYDEAQIALAASSRAADGRYVAVFDGFLANHQELTDWLRGRGITPRSTSDAEVLLQTFAVEGKSALRRLRGMYAFALWDTREQELLCGRDPFGIKPLYYSLGSGRYFRFASERKALAPAGTAGSIDPNALRSYLSFQYVPAPATMTPPVRSLPPGHFLVTRPGGPVDVFRYWRAALRPSKSPSPDTPEKILDALRSSVTAHMRADGPVGAFLSGGIDSAAICALAAQVKPGLMTFTVGFDREDYSEIEHATQTADALGVKSVPYVITVSEFAARLPEIVWHLDDPLADASAVPLWFAAREARKHVKAVLSGEGADELFGGYGVYAQSGVVRAGQALPAGMRAPIVGAASRLPTGLRGKGLLHRMSTPLRERYIGNARIFDDEQVDRLTLVGDGYAFDVTGPIFDQAEEMGLDDVATMQLIDINTWLPGDILVKADRVSAAHGLQLRSPYLDREVVAVASRLARAEKTAAGTTKFALREAVGSLLPQEIVERPKLAFPVPLGDWLGRELAGYAEQILVEAHTDEWLNKRAVLAVWQRFQSGDPQVPWRQVWTLLVFSLWHQIYIEKLYDPESLGWQDT